MHNCSSMGFSFPSPLSHFFFPFLFSFFPYLFIHFWLALLFSSPPSYLRVALSQGVGAVLYSTARVAVLGGAALHSCIRARSAPPIIWGIHSTGAAWSKSPNSSPAVQILGGEYSPYLRLLVQQTASWWSSVFSLNCVPTQPIVTEVPNPSQLSVLLSSSHVVGGTGRRSCSPRPGEGR